MHPQIHHLSHPVEIAYPLGSNSRREAGAHRLRLAALPRIPPQHAICHVERETGRGDEGGENSEVLHVDVGWRVGGYDCERSEDDCFDSKMMNFLELSSWMWMMREIDEMYDGRRVGFIYSRCSTEKKVHDRG